MNVIELASEYGLPIHKYADPTEGAKENISLDEAHVIHEQDPGLLYLGGMAEEAIVTDPDGGVWYPDPEALAEILSQSNPKKAAAKMAESEPMRGTWKQ